MQTDDGRGVVNILAADRLMAAPKVYSTLLLWLLSELFENLPEAGDLDKPKLVFFFDEAHLLFDDAPPALVDKIELVVRLIRSKGVGVFFVTQNPADVPDKVAAQLGNRVQHALRAFTPRDQKAVRAAAETMRDNPDIDEAAAIMELGVGEALVSMLDAKGKPGITERALILPPQAQIGPISPAERSATIRGSLIAGHYEKQVDRESAHEILKARAAAATAAADAAAAEKAAAATERTGTQGAGGLLGGLLGGSGRREGVAEALAKSAARAIGSQVGRSLIRGVLGSLLGGKR
ncbi:MAG: helicase HerA-like domain-containing protein, partial [Thiobacillus sp.]